MKNTPLDLSRLAAMDGRHATRLLQRIREAALAGDRPPMAPRPVIEASWQRMRRLGVSPDRQTGSVVMTTEELEYRRRTSALTEVVRGVCDRLTGVVDTALQILVVSDEQGRILWRAGSSKVMRQADDIRLEEGAAWSEQVTGTNAIGTALAARAPVQVHSAEHFVRTLTRWTCAAAPVHDPRDGRLLGVVDVSGPATGFHPTTLALVTAIARLAENELRERHLRAVERLRSIVSPILCRMGGRAVAVDTHGWTAAVTGMAPVDRLPLPKSVRPGRLWLRRSACAPSSRCRAAGC